MQALDQNPLPVAKFDSGQHSAVHVCPRLALEIDFPSSETKIGQKLSSGRHSMMQDSGFLFLDSLMQTLDQKIFFLWPYLTPENTANTFFLCKNKLISFVLVNCLDW